jgi:hypothetical protein
MLSIYKIVGKHGNVLVNAIVIDSEHEKACKQLMPVFFSGKKNVDFDICCIGSAAVDLKPGISIFTMSHLESASVFNIVDARGAVSDVLDTYIHQTTLKVRTKNVLEAGGVKTIKGLTTLTETELLKFVHMGPVTLEEIKNFLNGLGLSLRSEDSHGVQNV